MFGGRENEKKRKEKKVYLSEKDFVGEGSVYVRGVEEGDAGVNGMVDERDHIWFRLCRPIEGRHAHATKSLSRNLQTL